MAFMAAALPYLQAAGAVFSAIGAISQGNSAKNAADYNSQIAARNAGIARSQAAEEAEKQQRLARRVQGQMRAGFGANGVTMEGSALDVMENSAANAELDRLRLTYSGELKALGYESTAALDSMSGDTAKSQGYMGAASSLLTGVSKLPKSSSLSGRTSSAGYQLGDYSYATGSLA